MSAELKRRLELWVLVASLFTGGGAAVWVATYLGLPLKVTAAEDRLTALEKARATDHELLVRIEERLIAVQRTLSPHPSP